MPTKKGAGGKPQEYNEGNGQFGSENGRQNVGHSEYRQNTRYSSILESDGIKTYPQKPVAQGFNRSNTKSHLAHAKQMGLNEKEYVKAAEEFFNSGKGKLYYSSKGKFFKYDEKRNLVCICNQNGTIHSFYPYKTKNAFRHTICQEKLEEIK